MNFQDLKKIEKADFYIDLAFRRASKKTGELKKSIKTKDRTQKIKEIEIHRLDLIRTIITEEFKKILISFPSIDKLDIFYLELIKCTLDYASIKKSLGSVAWAIDKIEFFFKFYKSKIRQDREYKVIKSHSKEFYGRISSVVKQIKPYLAYLEESRRTMKDYPVIKTSVFTVCLFGFPNVGKSTLLSKLTTSKPEINSYPFTTKSLNLGYIKENARTIQIIDTPGTLNRFDKLNNIELQAYLALKHLTDAIIYIFDPTFEYEMEKQEKLLERVKEFEKPMLLYLSKTDKIDEKITKEFSKKFPEIIISKDKLREKIIELSLKKDN